MDFFHILCACQSASTHQTTTTLYVNFYTLFRRTDRVCFAGVCMWRCFSNSLNFIWMIFVSEFSSYITFRSIHATRRRKKDEWKLRWANVRFYKELFESLRFFFHFINNIPKYEFSSHVESCSVLMSDMRSTTSLSALMRLFCTCTRVLFGKQNGPMHHAQRNDSKSVRTVTSSHWSTNESNTISQTTHHFISLSFSGL